MNIKKNKRIVNKKLVMALVACNGLNLVSLGRLCDPPVTNAALSMLLSGKPERQSRRLIKQVAEIFHTSPDVLFPYKEDVNKPVIMVFDQRKHFSARLIEKVARIFKVPAIQAETIFPYEAGDA
jgi:transcriptional regulator with XRE-family HTH domain